MILMFGRTGQLARALIADKQRDDITALGRDAVDLTNVAAIADAIAKARPTVVVNAAAYTAVDAAEQDHELAHAINCTAPEAMARACAMINARFVTVSTDFVFDGKGSRPYRIDAPRRPLGVYGLTKAEGELAVLRALPDALIVRTAWVYDAQGRNFVSTMLRLMAERPEIGVVADQVGSPTSASSLARAIVELSEANAAGIHHFTDAGVASWYDFAVAVQTQGLALGLLDKKIPIRPLRTEEFPTPALRPAYSVLDKSVTWPLLGTDAIHWQTALNNTLQDKML